MNRNGPLRALLVLLILGVIVVAVWLLERDAESSGGVGKRAVTGSAGTRETQGDPVRRRIRYWRDEYRRRWLLELRNGKARARTIRRLRQHVDWQRGRLRTLQAHHAEPAAPDSWVTRQIAAADTLGRESAGDPWPNCPDPHDGSGASWQDTVNCENGGNWLDSPGFYRCGLQFDPMWEQRFGRLCP